MSFRQLAAKSYQQILTEHFGGHCFKKIEKSNEALDILSVGGKLGVYQAITQDLISEP